MLDDLSIHAAGGRLWPQTARLKAALMLARRQDVQEVWYLTEAAGATRILKRYLGTPVKGLWRDALEIDGRFAQGVAPAIGLYHIAGAVAALHTAAGRLAPA